MERQIPLLDRGAGRRKTMCQATSAYVNLGQRARTVIIVEGIEDGRYTFSLAPRSSATDRRSESTAVSRANP